MANTDFIQVASVVLSLPLESVIKDHQQAYYHALEQADNQADSTPFIHFMLSVIQQTLAQNASVNAPVKKVKTPCKYPYQCNGP